MSIIVVEPKFYNSFDDLISDMSSYLSDDIRTVKMECIYPCNYFSQETIDFIDKEMIDRYEDIGQGGSLCFNGNMNYKEYNLKIDGVLWKDFNYIDEDSMNCFDNVTLTRI